MADESRALWISACFAQNRILTNCNGQYNYTAKGNASAFPFAIGGMMKKTLAEKLGENLYKYYFTIMIVIAIAIAPSHSALAADDMWAVADKIIKDVYGKIAGISTALAGTMSAVAVIGAKLSNNQHKVDQAWDWLRRIWIAWIVINGIGAFLAYIRPLFAGLDTVS